MNLTLEQKVDSLVSTLAGVQHDLKYVKSDCHTIKRGLYGDKDNLVLGLMQRQLNDEIEIRKLKDRWKKVTWITVGVVGTIEVVSLLIKFL
jgi:hypothetical protein